MRRPKQPLLLFSLLLLLGCSSTPSPEPTLASLPSPTALTDPHNHVVDVVSAPVPPEIAAGFAYVEVAMDSQAERYKVVTNPEGVYRTFCIDEVLSDGGFQERLIVEDLDTGSTYEIQGLPLPGRPFSDLVWVNNDVLVFDRWAQPHYGTHYAVDVRRGVLLLASPFPDQLPMPVLPNPTPTATDIPAPASTLGPSPCLTQPTPIPSPTQSDLAQYYLPYTDSVQNTLEWMKEPPEDRQVVLEPWDTWGGQEISLLDKDGRLLARFTAADSGGSPPMNILWSRSKDRAVVGFYPPASTAMSFFIIDRDGNRLSDLRAAYWGPVWSPTDDLLAYQALSNQDGRLHIVDGNGVSLALSEPLSPQLCSSCSVQPIWAPEGSSVSLIVEIGDVAITWDIILCVLRPEGTVWHISLLDYDAGFRGVGSIHWLDNRYLLLEKGIWQQQLDGYRYRYFVFDTESRTIREGWNSKDLTPTPSSAP